MSAAQGDIAPYLWLQDDEDEAISDDGGVRLVASHEGSGPAVFITKEAARSGLHDAPHSDLAYGLANGEQFEGGSDGR